VIDPFKKARDADRDAAIEVVEAAYADGQLSKPDSELRVERLLQARTMGEIQAITRDIRSPETLSSAAPSRPTDLLGSTRDVMPAAQMERRPEEGSRTAVGVIVAVLIFVVLVVVGVAGAVFVTGVSDSTLVTGEAQSEAVLGDLTSASGYDHFVAALTDKTGSSVVFNATIYPGYAVVEVPVDDSSQRAFGWYYDGTWQEWTGSGTAEEQRLDLADLDGDVVAGTLKKVARRIDDPDATYVLVNPAGREQGVCLSAYANNELDETAYVNATCDGEIVFRYSS
jgi:hypothetical protein